MNYSTEQLIESYFAGTLSEAERLQLKQVLADDPKAADEFAWQQQLAQQVSKLSLSKSIQNETWREAAKPPFRKVNMWRTFMAAAAAIALLAVAYFFIPGLGGAKSETIVSDYFEHFPNKMKFKNLGGSEEVISPDILDAFAAYDSKDYVKAAQKMTAVVNANPTRPEFRFYLGVTFVGAQKYADAINVLTPVAMDATSPYRSPARYYLGVAYAGIKDVAQAKKYLQEYIDDEDGVTYRSKAKKLRRNLD
jgi:tetratricopeptide (TPR) repeat protein